MKEAPFAIKAFRGDGTPTVNPRSYFETQELAEKEARELSEYMLAGFVQVEKFNYEKGFFELVKIYESTRKPKNRKRAAFDDRSAADQQFGVGYILVEGE